MTDRPLDSQSEWLADDGSVLRVVPEGDITWSLWWVDEAGEHYESGKYTR